MVLVVGGLGCWLAGGEWRGRVVAGEGSNGEDELKSRAESAYRRLPMIFEANEGQVDGDTAGEVRYLARGHGYRVYLTSSEAVLSLAETPGRGTGEAGSGGREGVLRLRLTDWNRGGEIVALDRLPGQSNYLLGNDPAAWHSGVAQYGRVEYREVYPGVALAWYGTQQSLEYDFVVAPGADPGRIGMKIDGASGMEIDERGDLVLTVEGRRVTHRRPRVYQSSGQLSGKAGTRGTREIPGSYTIGPDGRIGFELGEYDRSKPLVIDPVIDYSTFVGGIGSDEGLAIAIDRQQNVYVTGTTYSNNFNVLAPLQTSNRGGKYDAFVTKIEATGAGIIYSTYLGGSGEDEGRGIAVDGQGNAIVAGITNSRDFNVRNGLQSRPGGASEDGFVAKIDESGSGLVFSTYLGGSDIDEAFAVAVDAGGDIFVAGSTNSVDFPVRNGPQAVKRGGYDAFLARIRADGSSLTWATYLGGNGFDEAYGVAVDHLGGAYIIGVTESGDFPTLNAFQPRSGGGADIFVARVGVQGTALVYATYLGGSGSDFGYGIDVDRDQNVYLTGHTFSSNFPVYSRAGTPLQAGFRGGAEAFVTEIEASGRSLVYSTFLGGAGGDFGRGIAVDDSGSAVVAGRTSSTDFNTLNPLQAVNRGDFDAFVTKIAPSGDRLIYSTYLGGNGQDLALGVAVDSLGNAYVTGDTLSTNFNTRNPLQPSNRGGFDAFVARINASGTTLDYSTYLGGSGEDIGLSIAIDAAGNAYITGYTSSNDFPTSNAIQNSSRGGLEVFVTKIFTDASAIAFNTYIGGNGSDTGSGIVVDQGGNCYVIGTTASTDFPVRNALQGSSRGGFDIFLLKLNATGSNLIFSTYIGGSSGDLGRALAIDASGAIHIVGGTFSADFPLVGPFQPTSRGGGDAFVAKVNPTATALVYSSFLGGSGLDEATAVALDAAGNVCVVGTTGSADFNVKDPLFMTIQGQQDVFVSKIAASGGSLLFSTWLGGSRNDVGNGIAVDRSGSIYVTGATSSTDFPRKSALQAAYGGGDFDAFLTKLSGTGSMVFSTSLGGSFTDVANAVSVDAQGNAYLTGITSSGNFPVKNGLQTESRGANEAFLTRFNAAGSDLIFSSYLGGSADDRGSGVVVDSTGVAYVVGATASADFNIQFPLVAYGGGTDIFVARVVSEAALAVSPRVLEVQLGKTATLTVALNVAATAPVTIALTSSNPALVAVPGSVIVPTGASTTTLTVTGKALGGPITISALLPDNVGGTTAAANVTVVAANRELAIPSTRVAAGGLLTLPVQLTAQGNENRIAFSVEIDPTVLITPQFLPGEDAANATIETSTIQETRGRYGFTIYLPQGQAFAAGTRELLIFQAVVVGGAGVASTRILFGDQPTVRRVSDLAGSAVVAGYLPAEIGITLGYEGDVSPRPNGSNGTVTTADWAESGRFAALLEQPAAGEFQRADTAPRTTLGSGVIGLADWVQTGRYAAGLDPIIPAGGPASGATGGPGVIGVDDFGFQRTTDLAEARMLSVPEVFTGRGRNVSLTVEVTAVGGENAFGFSLAFDATQLQYFSAAVGTDAAGATLNVNSLTASQGRLGIALALPPGQSLSGGRRRLVTVTFVVAASGGEGSLPVSFADQPIARELVNVGAEVIEATWTSGAVVVPRLLTSVSSASYRSGEFAPESILSAFGTGLSVLTQVVPSTPLPTELAGITVRVRDSAGNERAAPLFFVSPTQVNYLLPAQTALGPASVILRGAGGIYSAGDIVITPVAPSLFSADASGTGLAAANLIRVRPDGTQVVEPVGAFDSQSSRFLPIPIDLSRSGEQVFLVLYGTGFRGRSAPGGVTCRVGGTAAVVTFAGAQGVFVGLDQANVLLPGSLAGSGNTEIILTVDGQSANPVRITIR